MINLDYKVTYIIHFLVNLISFWPGMLRIMLNPNLQSKAPYVATSAKSKLPKRNRSKCQNLVPVFQRLKRVRRIIRLGKKIIRKQRTRPKPKK